MAIAVAKAPTPKIAIRITHIISFSEACEIINKTLSIYHSIKKTYPNIQDKMFKYRTITDCITF